MQLRLQPAELGNVQIDVTMRDGMLSARLEAQSPGTHQLLVDNLPQLKESLAQQGVQVDRLEVDLSDTFRNESSAGGFTGRPFEQHQHAEHGTDWEPNVPPQPGSERTVNAEARMPPARGSRGPITSLDVMV
jgi:flagellar hook-length control protein FliK